MISKKKQFIQFLILSSLEIDDETSGLIIKDAQRLDDEFLNRLNKEFLFSHINEAEIFTVLNELRETGFVITVEQNGMTIFKRPLDHSIIDIDNYDIWFRITSIGIERLGQLEKQIYIES